MRLPHGKGLPLPAYQSALAAGFDLVAAVPEETPLVLAPGAFGVVPTGLSMALPPGLEAQVRPRSGLAAKHGVTVLNSPGTIDADYRGEVGVILINHGKCRLHDLARRQNRANGRGAGRAGAPRRGGAAGGDGAGQRRLRVYGREACPGKERHCGRSEKREIIHP